MIAHRPAGGVLEGKAVLVTGAAVGLGRAYARHAAGQGAQVVVNDLTEQGVSAVVDEIIREGGTAVGCAGSVASWADAERMVATCQRTFGRVDGLVNNAGVIRIGPAWEADEAGIRALVEVNLMGAAYVGVHALRVMIEQGSGAIVNNTSSAQLGLMNMAVYGATKGSLASLTYAWSLEAAPHGVRVNAYSPVADTAMFAGSPVKHDRALPSPDENAPVVSYLLSDLARDVTGQVLQRRDDALVVMRHPELSEHAARPVTWTTEQVADAVNETLATGSQPVGDPRMRS